MTTLEQTPVRLSALAGVHDSLNATYRMVGGWQVPETYSNASAEAEAARNGLGLADISANGQLLVQGDEAATVLADAVDAVPAEIGVVTQTSIGGQSIRIGKLTRTRFLVVTGPGEERDVANALEAATGEAFVSVVGQTSGLAGLLVVGHEAAEMLAKLCGLPFDDEEFPDQRVQASSFAKVRATIFRNDIGELPAYELYFSRSSAEYMWEVTLDAGIEFEMLPIGWAALDQLRG